jgi:hypothetical protein
MSEEMWIYWDELDSWGDKPPALTLQVGGSHYKDMKIQPLEFALANNLSFPVGSIVKYACRYDKKGTPIQDLKKVIHFAQVLIEEEEKKCDQQI